MPEATLTPIPLAKEDMPEVYARASNAETPASIAPGEKAKYERSTEATSRLTPEARLDNLKKPAIEPERRKHAIESNVTNPGRRAEVERNMGLAAKLDQVGYDGLDDTTPKFPGGLTEKVAAKRMVIKALASQPDIQDRYPGLVGDPLMDPAIGRHAERILREGKYGQVLRTRLETATTEEDFIADPREDAGKARTKAETKRDTRKAEYDSVEERRRNAKKLTEEYALKETDAGFVGSRAEALRDAINELSDSDGEIAAIKLEMEGLDTELGMYTQRGMRENTRTTSFGKTKGSPASSQTDTVGRPLDPELAAARSKREKLAGNLRDAVAKRGKAEARRNSLQAEMAEAKQDAKDSNLAKDEARLKGELEEANEELDEAEKKLDAARAQRSLEEEAWAKDKEDILGNAALQYFKDNLKASVAEQQKLLQARAEKAGTVVEEGYYQALITRWKGEVITPRLTIRGHHFFGNRREWASINKLGTNDLMSKVDFEQISKSPADREDWFRQFMVDAGAIRSISQADVEKFLDNPNNAGKVEEMKKTAYNTLIERATEDKVISKDQLRILGTQPWFKQHVQEKIRNSPLPEVRSVPPSQVEGILNRASESPNMLAALLRVAAGIMLPQELSHVRG